LNIVNLFKSKYSKRQKAVLAALKKAFGFRPKKLEIYLKALRHKSAARNLHNDPTLSNERLEFLGDAILDAAVAEYLYDKYAEAEEGELTKMKSRIVSRKNLNEMAQSMGINPLLETDLQATHSRKSIGGNALEALIGAMYLDLGYTKTAKIILTVFNRFTDLRAIEDEEVDFKSRLFEMAHQEKVGLDFKTKTTEGEHSNTFTSVAYYKNKLIGEGSGTSKKKAEQKAAKAGLHKLNGSKD
jgi:ribonuclease-3